MMYWNWIDWSRKREALTISCPGPGIPSLRRCKAGPGQKIAKTTPCKVEWTPQHSCCAASGAEEGPQPNLIPLQVGASTGDDTVAQRRCRKAQEGHISG